jgi:hypothetical protein
LKRVIILVFSSINPPYDKLFEINKSTWGTDPDVFYLFSQEKQEEEVYLEENCIYCRGVSDLDHVINRILTGYKYVFENMEFDYIFLTCSGSYVVIPELKKFIEDKPFANYYCGWRGEHNHVSFASGAGNFISKDLIELIVKNREKILSYDIPPLFCDVMIGKFMEEIKIPIASGALRSETPDVVPGCYHYHFRINIEQHMELHRKLTIK